MNRSHHKVSLPAAVVFSGNVCRCLLFLCVYGITGCEFAFGFLGLFCNSPKHKHDLNEKHLLFACPKKSIYDEEVWCACLFTLAERRRKHLSPLSPAQIRCLYLFRVEEINPEWSIVGQRERWWKEGTDKEEDWFSIPCVCPCEQMASIGKPSLA